jgi:O-methyltransferase
MATQLLASSGVLSYVSEHSQAEDDILRELRDETASLPMGAAMQVSAEEGRLLAMLVKLTRARLVVEVGTFTGYSSLCMARALPPHGLLVTCDVTDRWPAFGRPYWRRAGVEDRIDLRIDPAVQVLDALFYEYGPGTVDLVFIDADKVGYAAYYEAALGLLAPDGLIVVDNTLFFGRVADPEAQDPDTVAIREFNRFVRDDPRVEMSLLPMADGITLIRKAG